MADVERVVREGKPVVAVVVITVVCDFCRIDLSHVLHALDQHRALVLGQLRAQLVGAVCGGHGVRIHATIVHSRDVDA
jgi:hypothetical protein